VIEQGPSGDLDADLRTALLALWIGNDHRAAEAFLRKSADQILNSAAEANEPELPNSLPPLANWYWSIRAEAAKVLAKGQSSAALAMAKRLPLSRSDKTYQARRQAKP
jgi:hypothetical protein